MTDSPEFLEKLAKVPTHVMLTPRVHRWRESDEWLFDETYSATRDPGWGLLSSDGMNLRDGDPPTNIGSYVYGVARRPIPENVRRSAAWWALYNSLATVAPDHLGIAYLYCLINRVSGISLTIDFENRMRHGIRKFESFEKCRDSIPILGGEETIIHFLSEGPLMDSWMGEQ